MTTVSQHVILSIIDEEFPFLTTFDRVIKRYSNIVKN